MAQVPLLSKFKRRKLESSERDIASDLSRIALVETTEASELTSSIKTALQRRGYRGVVAALDLMRH